MRVRLEVDEGIVQTRLGEARLIPAVCVRIISEIIRFIVIVTIAASEDIVYTSLDILHIR